MGKGVWLWEQGLAVWTGEAAGLTAERTTSLTMTVSTHTWANLLAGS